jgi:dephospho-CoA kinase
VLKVGLTGGVASGKSVVGGMFSDLGVAVAQADGIAHELMQPGKPVYDEVVRHFGKEILNVDGTINRPRLAEAAFGHAGGKSVSRAEELNRIVHPAVIQKQDEWMEEVGSRSPGAIVMVEAALILEAGAANRFDRLIVVTCRPEQRVERWAERLKVDRKTAEAEVQRRMAAQFPEAEKIKAADYIIDNSGLLADTRKQVERVFVKLQAEAQGRR